MKLTTRDVALQSAVPTAVVPRYGAFEALDCIGHRFLVARDGLWLEVRRNWCHIIVRLAEQSRVAMPYGELHPKIELAFGELPEWALERFLEDARAEFPNETGAVVIWDSVAGELIYEKREVLEAGTAYLRARWPTVSETRQVAIDLHSHGAFPAGFSEVDRRDTGGEVVIAVVMGDLGRRVPSVAVSLFACGAEMPMGAGWLRPREIR